MIQFFQELWPFIAHAGGASVTIAALLAAAWLSPVFKKEFVYAAVVMGVLLFSYSLGVKDEHKKWTLREAAITKQVHDAVKKAIESGEKDPYDDPSN